MHWPLCNATKDAVPTFVSHRALWGLAAPITTILRLAKRGWPGFGASAFFFFLAMAFGARRPRPRLWRFQLCSAGLGLPARAAESFGSSVTTAVRARRADRFVCLSSAVVFGSRAASSRLVSFWSRSRARISVLLRTSSTSSGPRVAPRAHSARPKPERPVPHRPVLKSRASPPFAMPMEAYPRPSRFKTAG